MKLAKNEITITSNFKTITMKQKLFLILVMMTLLGACNKSKPEPPEISLKGKWIAETSSIKEYENGILTYEDSGPGDGTTYDFQNNGHLVITSPSLPVESLPYTINPGSKVDIDGDIFDIQNLSASKVTLYLKQDYGQGDYAEVTLKLKR